MSALQSPKKASPKDWHPAEVVKELHIRDISLRQLALVNGYTSGTSLTKALRRAYPLAEALIAEALGIPASQIWPSRYGPDGKPNRGRGGRKPARPTALKPSRLRAHRNPQSGAR